MKKIIFLPFVLLAYLDGLTQSVNVKLQLETGRELRLQLQVKTVVSQQAMGQAIDFTVDATADHAFKVTNTTPENSTLRHTIQRVRFQFDGMGQKRGFDSGQEKDLNGPFGEPMRELLTKKYDLLIDSTGNTLMAMPEKITLAEGDSRLALVTNMLRDVFDLVQPPAKGQASFFKVLPASPVRAGDGWTESYTTAGGQVNAAYSIDSITDSLIVINYSATANTVTSAEMMGAVTTTTMKHETGGKITVDRATGIIRKKELETKSTGTTEGPFGSVPVTSRSTTLVTVE